MVITLPGGKEGDRDERDRHTLEKGRDKKVRQMRGKEGHEEAGEWGRYSERATDEGGRECKQETGSQLPHHSRVARSPALKRLRNS